MRTIVLLTSLALSASALAANDPARCFSIQNADLRQACLGATRGQQGSCYAIRDPDRRQGCLAQTTGSKSACYSVRNPDRRAACLAGMALP